MQTETFCISVIHSRHFKLSSNKFQSCTDNFFPILDIPARSSQDGMHGKVRLAHNKGRPSSFILKKKINLIGYFGSYDSSSVSVLCELHETPCFLSTFCLPWKEQRFKNPCSFRYRSEHAKFVFVLKFRLVLCHILSIQNVVITCSAFEFGRHVWYALRLINARHSALSGGFRNRST